jgi:hypothetical protein
MPLFVVGAPRSGTTLVTQALNTHPAFKIFDEVSLIEALDFWAGVVGKSRHDTGPVGPRDRRRQGAEQGTIFEGAGTGCRAGAISGPPATIRRRQEGRAGDRHGPVEFFEALAGV